MRKIIFGAFTLILSMIMSCGDAELAPLPNNESNQDSTSESVLPDSTKVLNAVPTYVTEALNNVRRLFDNLGETNEFRFDKTHFCTTDDNGNTFVIDTLGNVDIYFNTKDTIHIDYSVRDSNTPADTIYSNTMWRGWGDRELRQNDLLPSSDPDTSYYFYGAEFEDSVYFKDTYSRTLYKPECTRELRFKNSTCILSSWDTIKIYNGIYGNKYRKVKVKEQEYTNFIGTRKYKIEITDSMLYVYCIYLKDQQMELVDKINVDKDGCFTLSEGIKKISQEKAGFKAFYKYEAYNFKTNKRQICLYDSEGSQESWNTGLVLPCVFSHDDFFEAIDVIFEKVQE